MIKSVAESFPPNPAFDTEKAITELGIGEALVSVLNEKGSPQPVQRTLIRPPESQIGPLSESERQTRLERSPLKGRYDEALDRESAYEVLKERAEHAEQEAKAGKEHANTQTKSRASNRQSVGEAFIKTVTRTIGSQIGRRIVRGIMGSLFGGR